MLQILVVTGTLVPAAVLAGRFWFEGPGANPIEDITHVTGEWGLRFVLASLAVSPLRSILGRQRIAPLRRTLGLAGFGYAVVHLVTWAYFDLELDANAMFEDVLERPYVTAGMSAFVILAALAATSTQKAMRRLGTRWIRLHRLVYLAAVLAVTHHFWLTKADYRPALVHAGILAILLASRVYLVGRRRNTSDTPSDRISAA